MVLVMVLYGDTPLLSRGDAQTTARLPDRVRQRGGYLDHDEARGSVGLRPRDSGRQGNVTAIVEEKPRLRNRNQSG